MTTVLESADDQCRMSVTCGNTPDASGVAGKESLSSSFSIVSVAVSTIGAAVAAGVVIVAGGNGCDVATVDEALALAERALWPSFHHTPAPRAAAINRTAATTARPGGGDLSCSGSAGAGSTTATALDFELSVETNSGLVTELGARGCGWILPQEVRS